MIHPPAISANLLLNRQGFTLLELSIVLVIIGLIIGGITVGADMIRSAELSSVASDFTKYRTSINTFRLKYNALPGDMKNATAYWPTAAGNGNGNRAFDDMERMKAWNHLGLSGIVPGSYAGTRGYNVDLVLGVDMPESRVSGAGFGLRSGPGYGNTQRSYIEFGVPRDGGLHQLSAAALSPPDAHAIDVKIDDGIANKGKMEGYGNHDSSGCTGSSYTADPGTDYLLSVETPACYLKWILHRN